VQVISVDDVDEEMITVPNGKTYKIK